MIFGGDPASEGEREMGILDKIFGRIFPKANAGQAPANPTAQAQATKPAGQPQAAPQQAPTGAAPAGAAPTATMDRVDIEQVLDGMAAKNPQKLNWRTSIVDLMKLVGMDSTLQERKELADELGYSGDKSDTAAMNMWLHKQVMKKLQENGGKVPADLLD
jgi:3-oxoacyl-ACP reductase-like protein